MDSFYIKDHLDEYCTKLKKFWYTTYLIIWTRNIVIWKQTKERNERFNYFFSHILSDYTNKMDCIVHDVEVVDATPVKHPYKIWKKITFLRNHQKPEDVCSRIQMW